MNIRYIRDYLDGSNVNSGNHWIEIQAFDYSGNNIALNKTVTGDPAYDFYCFSTGSSDMRMLTNGVTTTDPYMEPVYKGTTDWAHGLIYVQVDLGDVYSIKSLRTFHYWYDARYYTNKTEVSVDGKNWVTVYDSEVHDYHRENERGFYIPMPTGIKYNDHNIGAFMDYNDNRLKAVYYNGDKVFDKSVTELNFTFSGDSVTGIKNSYYQTVTIPSTYSVIQDINGNRIFIEGTDEKVTRVREGAFENSVLISVTLPSTIKVIEDRAFQFSYFLSTVNMSATPEHIGYCAFALTALPRLTSYMYNCPSLGQGCFATRNGWISCGSTTDLGGDAKIKRLLATNMGGTLSKDGYYGAGQVASVRSRFNVHVAGSGTNTPSGGSFYCTWGFHWNSDSAYYGATLAVGGSYLLHTHCIASTEKPYVSESVTCESAAANQDSWSWGVANKTLTLGGTCDHDVYAAVVGTCLVKGTPILLHDGTTKNIEYLTYKDLLMVWNFETGTYDYQYPLGITKGTTHGIKYRLTLEDDSYLDICGCHDIYDPVIHKFRTYGNGAIHEIKEDCYVLKYLNNESYACRKIVSIEIMETETTSYNIVTGGTITAFANNIMVGLGTLNFARIKNSNSFEKEFQKDKDLCYTYDRFKEEIYSNSSKYLILGLNLHYVDYYNKDSSGLPIILAPFNSMIEHETKNNKYVCTIGLLDGDTLIESEHLEDEEIILPEIKSELKTHWYVVGEYKYLKPGDTYKINFSTLIRAV